ncbi:MAG: hypothetical protein WD690_07705 [Vicinamibacterales bacterium]
MDSRRNPHDHTPDEEREIRESALDETIEDSFPASDPPSTLPNPDDHDAAERRDGGRGTDRPSDRPGTKRTASST